MSQPDTPEPRLSAEQRPCEPLLTLKQLKQLKELQETAPRLPRKHCPLCKEIRERFSNQHAGEDIPAESWTEEDWKYFDTAISAALVVINKRHEMRGEQYATNS